MTTPTPHRSLNTEGPATVAISEHTVATLAEILGLAEEFLRTAGATTHAELRTYLAHQVPPADPGWFIDMLGFNAIHLHHQLRTGTLAPRETWQEAAGQPSQEATRR